jgi:hypothetical protein
MLSVGVNICKSRTTYLDGHLKKTINKAGEGVPVSELPIARGACSATVLHNDEFDDLLLEVVVFSEVQSTAKKEGHAWMPSRHRDKVIHVLLGFCPTVFQHRRQTDGYEG